MRSVLEIQERKSLANSVPAAAVRQRGRVLSLWTRYKKQVGGNFCSLCNSVIDQTNNILGNKFS